ncbi:MAG TPA: glycerophosphodiester phosphodiesterase family protein [Caulobacterales bacterium]|nr:glycerophosphodiester phosphodiesterase family protein [Caulobacterales bacterium]
MRKRWIALGAVAAAAAALFVVNASMFARPEGEMTILAHRGVHQRFSLEGLGNDDCTATRIATPTTEYLENTIPSMRAAFSAGATRVEIDAQETTDGDFVVFHDWGLDCRTNGHGVTREHAMSELRSLDAGYGYTADGGRTFPFRGKGVGLIPSLRDVLVAFPTERFLINFKSNDANEADLMVRYLESTPEAHVERLAFYGAKPADRIRETRPAWRSMSRNSLMSCAKGYLALGWTGFVPNDCRHTVIFAPANYAPLAWGWPNRFLQRMQDADTEVYIAEPVRDGAHPNIAGVDDAVTYAASVPAGWRGGVSTDAIEVIGPLARRR